MVGLGLGLIACCWYVLYERQRRRKRVGGVLGVDDAIGEVMKRVSEDKEEIWVKRGCVRDGNVLRFTNWHAVEKKKAVDFVTKRNGWGYQDSGFFFSKQVQQVFMSGKRYQISGESFPALLPWASRVVGIDENRPCDPIQDLKVLEDKISSAIQNHEFLQELASIFSLTETNKATVYSQKNNSVPQPKYESPFSSGTSSPADFPIDQPNVLYVSSSAADRLDHSHGQTLEELYALRNSQFSRYVDYVIWPRSHQQVEEIIKLANKHDVGIIPFGGGTSVSLAVLCPENESRMLISLDMKKMDRILEIDLENMCILVEAGTEGLWLENSLKELGLTVGHEPDSLEFSTVGGWIATRASGMKKNTYGNIEDIVLSSYMVSPSGVLTQINLPRVSIGMDLRHIALGSEGIFGVITAAKMKIHHLPKIRKYQSLLLPNFNQGFKVVRDVAKNKLQPTSIRLMDSLQFQLAHCLMPSKANFFTQILKGLQKFYVTRICGFNPDEMVAITLLFEGNNEEEINAHMNKIIKIGKKHGGIATGGSSGEKGYQLTFAIGYLRDFVLDYQFVTESFETTVPYDKVVHICTEVKEKIKQSCKARNLPYEPFITCRVTQTYDTGCCVYFYFGFVHFGFSESASQVYHELESEAREIILQNGGSLSHHHGIGKLRKKWVKSSITSEGVSLLQNIKGSIDPKNIFCSGNLISAPSTTQ